MNKMVVVILAIAFGAAGAGGTFLVMKGSPAKAQHQEKAADPVHNLALEERTVNLTGAGGKHYLKMTLVLEVAGKGDLKKLGEERKPQLMDRLIEVASKHSYDSLLTAEGKRSLKEELLESFSAKMEGSCWEVKDVLFTDFVME